MDDPVKHTNHQRTEWQMVIPKLKKQNSVHSEQTTAEFEWNPFQHNTQWLYLE